MLKYNKLRVFGQIAHELEKELIEHFVSGISVLEKNEDLCYYNLDDIDELTSEVCTVLNDQQKKTLIETTQKTYLKHTIGFCDRKCIREWNLLYNKSMCSDLTLETLNDVVTKSKFISDREREKAKKFIQILTLVRNDTSQLFFK